MILLVALLALTPAPSDVEFPKTDEVFKSGYACVKHGEGMLCVTFKDFVRRYAVEHRRPRKGRVEL